MELKLKIKNSENLCESNTINQNSFKKCNEKCQKEIKTEDGANNLKQNFKISLKRKFEQSNETDNQLIQVPNEDQFLFDCLFKTLNEKIRNQQHFDTINQSLNTTLNENLLITKQNDNFSSKSFNLNLDKTLNKTFNKTFDENLIEENKSKKIKLNNFNLSNELNLKQNQILFKCKEKCSNEAKRIDQIQENGCKSLSIENLTNQPQETNLSNEVNPSLGRTLLKNSSNSSILLNDFSIKNDLCSKQIENNIDQEVCSKTKSTKIQNTNLFHLQQYIHHQLNHQTSLNSFFYHQQQDQNQHPNQYLNKHLNQIKQQFNFTPNIQSNLQANQNLNHQLTNLNQCIAKKNSNINLNLQNCFYKNTHNFNLFNDENDFDEKKYFQLINYHENLIKKSFDLTNAKETNETKMLNFLETKLNNKSTSSSFLSSQNLLEEEKLTKLNLITKNSDLNFLLNSKEFSQSDQNYLIKNFQNHSKQWFNLQELRPIRSCRRQRTTFTNDQTIKLEIEYRQNEYISRNKRFQLATLLDLTENQIKIWFQNRRAKDKRIEKAILDQQLGKILN